MKIRAYEIHKKKIEKINHQIEKTKLKKPQNPKTPKPLNNKQIIINFDLL
jgi:hypothetical protein